MDKNDGKTEPHEMESATLPGPAVYEEALKDFSITSEETVSDSSPDHLPEPVPARNT